jgi:peptidoglycan/xylan/chitin deacetylase (PgdA/CDA1 family)
VALTFDAEHPDRPTRPGVTDSILETLSGAGVRATFFLQGRWVESNRETARRIANAGHLVGSHSFYHARMPLLSDDGFRTDVRHAERAIRRYTGVDPRPWFRCPFGAGHDDPRTTRLLSEMGYRDVHWDVTTNDWQVSQTGTRLARHTADEILGLGRDAVVLMHSWPRPTRLGLPGLIERLAERNVRFVGVDELIVA